MVYIHKKNIHFHILDDIISNLKKLRKDKKRSDNQSSPSLHSKSSCRKCKRDGGPILLNFVQHGTNVLAQNAIIKKIVLDTSAKVFIVVLFLEVNQQFRGIILLCLLGLKFKRIGPQLKCHIKTHKCYFPAFK